MKKIFLFLMFISTFAFGAQTNLFNSVKITTSLQYTPGAGAGLILQSDATGGASWQPIGSTGAGDVFAASNNVFTGANTFTAAGGITNNGFMVVSNITIRGTQTTTGFAFFNGGGAWAAGTTMTNNGNTVLSNLTVRGISEFTGYATFHGGGKMDAGTTWTNFGTLFVSNFNVMGTSTFTGPSTFNGVVSNNNTVIDSGLLFLGAGSTFTNNGNTVLSNLVVNGAFTLGPNSTFTNNGNGTVSNFTVLGNLAVNGNTTLGDAAGDTITFNAQTLTAPNALNINAGVMSIPASTAGVYTNGVISVFQTNINLKGSFSMIKGMEMTGLGSPNNKFTLSDGNNDMMIELGAANSFIIQNDSGVGTNFFQVQPNIFTFRPAGNSVTNFQILNNAGLRVFTVSGLAGGRIQEGTNGINFGSSIYTNASLGFPTILAAGQVEERSFTLTGAVAGDPVIAGYPATLPGDSMWQTWCSNANTIIVRRVAASTTAAYTNTFSARQIVQ